MSWFSRKKAPKPSGEIAEKSHLPDDIWTKCPGCSVILYTKELTRNFGVCNKCNYHFRLSATQRINLLADRHSFVEFDSQLGPADPLSFKDDKGRYRDRTRKLERVLGAKDAIKTGQARIVNIAVMLGAFEFGFLGGSMGSVVGEKVARLVEAGCRERWPVVIVSASGGARMHEGILSLMQMAKVSAALGRLAKAGVPYVSVLTDPTTGGVAASLAMLGDVILAEPGALIGFAGPRVIEQTIRQKLPEGFQRSEFLLEHGMVDRIVSRVALRNEIAVILKNFGFGA